MTPRRAHVRRGERAFERLYRRHVADVYRYTLVLLRDPEDAELVTQTTFLNAYGAYRRGHRPRRAHPWLLAMAHEICRRRVGAPAVDADDDVAVHAVRDPAPPSPADIRRALARLPFEQRAALVMRELEGRSYAEISEVLELPAAAIERLVFEGRHALREQLEGALSCHEAERAISLRMDGRLPRRERRALRAHLRECEDCAGFERGQLAQRTAWKTLGRVPLPASLQSFFGPDGVLSTRGGIASVAVAGVTAKLLVAAAAAGAAALALGHETQPEPARAPALSAVPEEASRALPSQASASPPTAPREAKPRAKVVRHAAPAPPRPTRETTPPPPTLVRAAPPSRRAARSQAFPIRLRTKPRGNPAPATVARPRSPASPSAGSERAPTPTVVAAPAQLPPVALPQFPPTPPLPLPLPPPPRLP